MTWLMWRLARWLFSDQLATKLPLDALQNKSERLSVRPWRAFGIAWLYTFSVTTGELCPSNRDTATTLV
jgi:hypothetical protein